MLQRYEPRSRTATSAPSWWRASRSASSTACRPPARRREHGRCPAGPTKFSARDRAVSRRSAPPARAGAICVGIDVIGDWLTEINVTSPTGLQEVARFGGVDLEATIWDSIEARVAAR